MHIDIKTAVIDIKDPEKWWIKTTLLHTENDELRCVSDGPFSSVTAIMEQRERLVTLEVVRTFA